MRTNEFQSIVSDEAKKLCFEYSENPEKLKELFADKKFDVKIRFEDIDFYFPDDKEKRQIITFQIFTKNGQISHKFGMSINDTRKIDGKFFFPPNMKIHMLYDILTSLNFYVEDSLDDFANEFGYDLNENFKQVKKIHEDSLQLYNDCLRIFGEDFTEYFPS